MSEWTWLIVIGLGLDILGAILIVGPIRHGRRMFKRLSEVVKEIIENMQKAKEGKLEKVTPENNKERIEQLAFILNDRLIEELEGYKKIVLGIAILVLGFILQIIRNWLQNPPF